MKVIMIAAPASGSGKTVLTLALLRALKDRGVAVTAAKAGPDYIDPQFHAAACGAPSVNLDPWAMDAASLRARAAAQGGDLLVVEAAMGLIDGAADGRGSAADLAAVLGAPVLMVIDAARQAQSAALPLAGAAALRPDVTVAGAILNRIGSARHERIASASLERAGFRTFGAAPRDDRLATPSRHLGLVQAEERPDLEEFIAGAAELIADRIDIEALIEVAAPLNADGAVSRLPPLGQRIAVAHDQAFAFAYPHLLSDWRAQGSEVSFFSPLADQGPAKCDAVFLPGGYPEMHGAQLASAERFKTGMRAAAKAGAVIYGECGGYMTLGDAIIDAEGRGHEMLGLLPVTTSFQHRKLSLGYRQFEPLGGPWEGAIYGHEFHYATIAAECAADRLFRAHDAGGADLGEIGLRVGTVSGSFAHVIAPAVGCSG
ncbi:MAG: cobyrinate a,c-diamide synthase [Pseudomonadota bacterium]